MRDDKLTEARLLHVAKGGEPAGIDEIVDVPIDAIPAVPPGHPSEYKFRMDVGRSAAHKQG